MSIGKSFSIPFKKPSSLQPESVNLIARMTTAPSPYQKIVINNTIILLKAYGLWDKLDTLQFYCSHSKQSALLNWIGNYSNANLSATEPLFFEYYGFRGNEISAIIKSNFIPSASIKFLQNDALIGCKVQELANTGAKSTIGAIDGAGNNIGYLANFSALKQISQINSGAYTAADDVNIVPVIGITSLARIVAGQAEFNQNVNTALNIKASTGRPSVQVYLLASNNNGVAIQFSRQLVSCFYSGGYINNSKHLILSSIINYYYNNYFEDNKIFYSNICLIGDSTIAEYKPALITYSNIYYFLRYAGACTSLATPGETILQQHNRWTALPPATKAAMNYVFVQIGLNDLNPAETAHDALLRYQSLINDIIADSPTAKIIIGTMTPCKARLITIYGAVQGLVAYQKWLDMNFAMQGNGVDAIIGFYKCVSKHTDLLNDGFGNLAAAYNIGDDIHENQEGRAIIAHSWNSSI